MSTLITGGAGYIGSHVVYELLDAGREVVVVDDLSTGVRENVPDDLAFVEGNMGDASLMGEVVDRHDVGSVIHFAGSIVVPESVEKPLMYYRNNFSNTRNLLEVCVDRGVGRFVFSSTAAVYGEPDETPITEQTPTDPINPYGRSKLAIEWMLEDVAAAHEAFSFVALRYFNVAGADPEGRTGQSTPNATHLIKVASQAALGERERLEIFGTDYPTRDGTCLRDYIHVSDLAAAHRLALDHLEEGADSDAMNCGYGDGYTVREVVDAVKAVCDRDFPVEPTSRRPGDPPALVADASRLRGTLDWEPQYDDLEFIVRTALEWESQIE